MPKPLEPYYAYAVIYMCCSSTDRFRNLLVCSVGTGRAAGNSVFSRALSDAQGNGGGFETGSRQQGGMRSDSMMGEHVLSVPLSAFWPFSFNVGHARVAESKHLTPL